MKITRTVTEAEACWPCKQPRTRMKIKYLWSPLLLLTATTLFAAEDKTGQHYIGGGVGSVVCPSFTSSLATAKVKGVGSVGYWRETSAFTHYISGFQTAYNLQTNDTCDIFGNFTNEQLLAWLDNYCQANPLEKFGAAVISLSREVHSKRVRVCR